MAAQRDDPEEEQESIWTLRGREAISERIVQLIQEGTSRVVFGVMDDTLLTSGIMHALRDCDNRGVDVFVLGSSPSVRNHFVENENITVLEPHDHLVNHDHMGRMLLVDYDTVLHSMNENEGLPDLREETAFWSSGSGFASTFIAMVNHFLDEPPSHQH